MSTTSFRYKVFPQMPDTSGFFDKYVPYTNQSVLPKNDSLAKFYDFGIYDYITPKHQVMSERPGPSVFTGHSLVPSSHGPRPIEKSSGDWVTMIVILNLLIIAWIQTNHSKRLKQIIRSVALPYSVNQLEREGNLYNERITLGLGIIYLTTISMLINIALTASGASLLALPAFLNYLIILGILAGWVMIKALFVQTAGVIFKTFDHTHAYRLNTLIFNQTAGLILFPFLLLSLYYNPFPFIWISAGILVIILIYRFIRSLSIGLSNSRFSVFYLILYLCTLEILPVVLMVKFVRHF